MAITLEQLTSNSNKKYQMRLLGGKTGLDNTVRWVHMVEDRNVPDFLHGNELIFTTGIGHIKGEGLLKFVSNLNKRGAVGVVVNLGPYISRVPAEVVEYCDGEGFPIFSLPWEVRIIDITFDYCSRIIENEKIETNVAEVLANIFTSREFKAEYAEELGKIGLSDDKSLRVASFCFLRNGKQATGSIFEKNKHSLWRILGLSKKSSALFLYENSIIAVKSNFKDSQAEKIISQLTDSISSDKLAVRMGISDISVGYKSLPLLQRQAFAAMCSGRCDGKPLTYYREIGMDKIICGVRNIAVLRDYSDKLLLKLAEHDDIYATNLTQFLSVYLELDCSVKDTAERLSVHRNTVNYQIRQIKELLEISLNVNEKANILFALRIKKLLDREIIT